LFNKDKTNLILFPSASSNTTYVIPDSVISLDKYSFNSCTKLTSVTIPSSIATIYIYVFYLCNVLSSVTFMGVIPTIHDTTNFSATNDTAFYKSNINTDQTLALSQLSMFTTKTPWVTQESVTTLTNFSIPTKTFGDAAFQITPPTTNSDGIFSYISSNTAVATITGSTVTIIGVGSSTITAIQAGTANFISRTITTTLAVNRATTVLSNFSVPTKIIGDASFNITNPTTNSDNTFTYTSSNTSVATVSGTTVTIIGVGSSTITASQAITSNYTSATINTIFVVNTTTATVSPTITNFSDIVKIYLNAPFTVSPPTSDSSGLFSYSSSNIAVATVSGTTVTIVGVGNSTIRATQTSDATYLSGEITATLTVSQATPTISSFTIPIKTNMDSPFVISNPTSNSTASFTYTSSNTAVATINSTTRTITIIGIGTSTITAVQASNANYTSGSTTTTLTVNQATPALTGFTAISKTWGNAAFNLVAPTSNSTGSFTYTSSNLEVATISGTTVTIVGGGTSTITATQAGDANYTSGSTTAILTVGKATPALSGFFAISKTFGAAAFTISPPTSTSTGAFTYTRSNMAVATISGTTVTIVGAGSSTITATQATTTNYLAGTATATLTVSKAAPIITGFSVPTKTFGDAAFTISPPTSTSTGAFTYTSSYTPVATVSGTTVTIVSAGIGTTITATQAATANHLAGTATATLTVSKATPALSGFANITVPIDLYSFYTITKPTSNSNGAFSYTSSNTAVATITNTTGQLTIRTTGITVITATQIVTANYTSAFATAAFSVDTETTTPTLAPTITNFSVPTKTFGDAAFNITAPASDSTGLFTYISSNTAVATVSGTTVTIVGIGTSTISAVQACALTYRSGSITATLTVSKAAPTISNFSVPAKTFGDAAFTISNPTSNSTGLFTYTSSNLLVATVSGTTVTIVGPGTSTITATQATTTIYLSGTITATFTVSPVNPPTITNFVVPAKTVGDATFTISPPTTNSTGAFTYTSSNTSVATISGTTVTIVGVGNSTITATQDGDATYSSGTITATLSVSQATPTITNFSVPAKAIGDTAFNITAPTSNSAGLITYTSSDTAVATIIGTTITIVGGGTSTITATQASNGNYLSGTTTATLTVNQITTVLSGFSAIPKIFGDAAFIVPPPTSNSTGGFTYTSSDLTVATVSGDIITIVGGGTSTITATQASTTNYNSGTTTTTLTVSPGPSTITSLTIPTKIYGNADFTITDPISNSAGAFTYTSSNSAVATVAGSTITIVGVGTSTITAVQASTTNYTSGTTTGLFEVIQAAPALSNFSIPAKTFDDTPFIVPPPTSNSTGAFTYTSSNPAVATIAGTTITIIGVGTSTITAVQANTTNYTSGTTTAILTVAKAIPILSGLSVPSKPIGNKSVKLNAPVSKSSGTITYASSNASVARVKGSTATIVGGGISTITAFQESTPNYESATLTGFLNNATMTSILNNGTMWVAGGSTLKYSTTGKIWTTVPSPTDVNSLAWTGTQWIAGCDGSNNLYTSNDAITWNLNTSLQAYTILKVAYANNIIFVLSVGTIFFSQNLGSWSSHTESVGDITGFTYTGTHYLFSSGTTLIKTQDLTTWTTASLPSASTNLTINNSSQGSATVKPITIACSDSTYNTLGYTYDGIQWYGTGNTVLQVRANHVAWNGTVWVTVGKSVGTWFAVSRDGINWQQQADAIFDEAYAVAWNGSYWIVAGEGSAYSLATSTDGVSWTGIAGSKTLFSVRATDVAWNGVQWTAYGSPTTVATSPDGTTWTLLPTVVGDVSSVLLSSPTYTATSSTGANPEYIFDLSLSTAWSSDSGLYDSETGLYSGSDPAGGEWLHIDLTTPYAVKHYSFASSNSLEWMFDGSPDGLDWTTLDSQTMEYTTTASNQLFLSTTNTTEYQYYRIVITKVVAGSTSVQVNDVDLFFADLESELSKYYRICNTKKWISSVVNTGYSSLMQYDEIPGAYLNGRFLNTSTPISLQTSYSYDGQYNLITDLSNANVYYATDFSNNVFTSVSLPSMETKYSSCFNGTHFFVGGSGTNLIMYAHSSDMTTWFPTANADTAFSGGKILALVSNSGLGFVSPPNSIYLTPGEKLALVAPKFYDENMEKRGATFNFTLR